MGGSKCSTNALLTKFIFDVATGTNLHFSKKLLCPIGGKTLETCGTCTNLGTKLNNCTFKKE